MGDASAPRRTTLAAARRRTAPTGRCVARCSRCTSASSSLVGADHPSVAPPMRAASCRSSRTKKRTRGCRRGAGRRSRSCGGGARPEGRMPFVSTPPMRTEPAVGRSKPASYPQQRRLARTRRSDQRRHGRVADLHVDALQRHPRRPSRVHLHDARAGRCHSSRRHDDQHHPHVAGLGRVLDPQSADGRAHRDRHRGTRAAARRAPARAAPGSWCAGSAARRGAGRFSAVVPSARTAPAMSAVTSSSRISSTTASPCAPQRQAHTAAERVRELARPLARLEVQDQPDQRDDGRYDADQLHEHERPRERSERRCLEAVGGYYCSLGATRYEV